MRRHLLLVAVLASTTPAGGQTPVRDQLQAAIQALTPLCAEEETTDDAEAQLLRTPASAAVATALKSEAAFWKLLTDPATPYLDRMMAAQYGAGVMSVERLPTLWRTAAQVQSVPVGVYPSPCYFLRSAQYGPTHWLRRKDRSLGSFGATVSAPASRLVAGRTVALPVEAVDYPVTLDARANAPWLWQMRRAFSILMPGVRKHFAEPSRYVVMAETAWSWQPTDHHESHERVEALRTGPRNAEWVNILVRLVLERPPTGDSSVVRDLYVHGNDAYHLEELVHAAQIIILQRTDRWDVAFNAAYQAGHMTTANYASFSKVLKPIRTATAALAIARWATNADVKERDRYGFATYVCRMVDDPPFTPNPAIMNSMTAFATEVTSSLAAFDAWFANARPRLQQQAEGERARLNALAAELGRQIE